MKSIPLGVKKESEVYSSMGRAVIAAPLLSGGGKKRTIQFSPPCHIKIMSLAFFFRMGYDIMGCDGKPVSNGTEMTEMRGEEVSISYSLTGSE